MSDNEDDSGKGGRTISLRGGGTETSRVRQSFSHGRTKSVVVEKKRKRMVVPGQGGGVKPIVPKPVAPPPAPPAPPVSEAPAKPKAAPAPKPAPMPAPAPAPKPTAPEAATKPSAPATAEKAKAEAPPAPTPKTEPQKPAAPEPAAKAPEEVKPVEAKPAAPEPAADKPAEAKPAETPPPVAKAPARPAKPAPAPARRPAAPAGRAPEQRRGGARGRGEKPAMLKSLSKEEYERRIKALQAAKADEGARRERDAEEARRREEEREARRAELEEARRREEEEAIRVEREEAERIEREKKEEAARARAAAANAKSNQSGPAALDPSGPPPEDDRGPKRRTSLGAPAGDAKRQPPPSRTPRDGGDRRRSGKLTIAQATGDNEQGRQRSLAAMRRRQQRDKRKGGGSGGEREKVVRDVVIPDIITVQELANRMAERVADVIKALMANGIMATQNQSIDADTAELLVAEFGHKVNRVSESDVETAITTVEDDEEAMQPRAPVVTVMGHVDHGKTSVLDALRKTTVVAGEAGGITQHIGAYQIEVQSGQKITFLDTPGHAAFTSMRARGAHVTDIVVLVVAADDAVMPQTVEAINHAKAAEVPIIVAINKIDLPAADPKKVRTDLLQHNVIVEEMSGDVLDVEVSAVKGTGLDKLVDAILLQAELLDLKANPDRAAEGAVVEAQLDVGRGPVATVLVQKGTLRTGDIFVVGEQWGKVRALIDDKGDRVKEAGPSVPVEVLGLNGTPQAGDVLNVVSGETEAREIADYRQRKARELQGNIGSGASLDQLLAQAKANQAVSELPIVVKSDVQGSAEAIVQAMDKLGNDEVKVRVLHSGVGAITESDVTLAEASGAPIIGFNVRANAPARTSAQQKGVEIRYYSIIYNLVDDIKAAASGLLSDEVRETFIGYATIKEVFKITGTGKVAGCIVTEGVARRSAGVRLLRDNVVIHTGKLKTLKRFKDEVKEVQVSQECGMAFENYEDIREGDVIEIFETETIERTL
ncbi:translation initiation factor IF-2 [Pikeienuella piscinae]|uniref:Translation initiation factor IF-2 n=1 Tax=Pikeienuella piscinae TaxID=2748098 RepID=A0A7L5BZA7_9RHOB|nr:translation initiation factor IF-2 [Pikeienuella piscinae]